jgi:hypothetical protein
MPTHDDWMTRAGMSTPPECATREEWLTRAITLIDDTVFIGRMPSQWRVSCGFPSKKALSTKGRAVGQCFSPECSDDGVTEIFVSPVLDDVETILGVLTHEMIHAIVGIDEGHRGAFADVWESVGFAGKKTECTLGSNLKMLLHSLLPILGPYPHSMLSAFARAKVPAQHVTWRKLRCPGCGYAARTTQKYLDKGLPVCPCGKEMEGM